MDTSEEYVLMCREAKEIQAHEFIYGDLWSDDGFTVKVVLPNHFPVANCIWLPRQDQLQEMVKEDTLASSVGSFIRPYDDYGRIDIPEVNSWEQLWLAFVMQQKYNKTWNGETWL